MQCIRQWPTCGLLAMLLEGFDWTCQLTWVQSKTRNLVQYWVLYFNSILRKFFMFSYFLTVCGLLIHSNRFDTSLPFKISFVPKPVWYGPKVLRLSSLKCAEHSTNVGLKFSGPKISPKVKWIHSLCILTFFGRLCSLWFSFVRHGTAHLCISLQPVLFFFSRNCLVNNLMAPFPSSWFRLLWAKKCRKEALF